MYTLCMRAVNAQASLCICADSSEHTLFTDVKNTAISCIDQSIICHLKFIDWLNKGNLDFGASDMLMSIRGSLIDIELSPLFREN